MSDGTVTSPSGRTTSYWELAGGQAVTPNDGGDGVTQTGGRWDLPPKFRGESSFVQDLELPGMLHGRVIRPPSPNATLTALDSAVPNRWPEYRRCWFQGALLALLPPVKSKRSGPSVELSWTQNGMNRPRVPHPRTPGTSWNARRRLRCRSTPWTRARQREVESIQPSTPGRTSPTHPLGHRARLPIRKVTQLTIWCASQGVFQLRGELCAALGLDEEDVRIIHMEGAGCYGHNGSDDVALDAALLARAVPGTPVRVQWSRADEFAWEPYGSPMVLQLNATLDEEGNDRQLEHRCLEPRTQCAAWRSRSVLACLAARHMENPHPMPGRREPALPAGGLLRNSVPLYDLPNMLTTGHFVVESPVRTSALRGLGSQGNIFAIESFMDELSALAGDDPVEFRLKHLADERAKTVIRDVVDRAGVPIGGLSPEGHGYGLAFCKYKNVSSYVAVVAEVEAEHDVRLVRVWASVDAGKVVNPDGVLNQIEGGLIQSASWALKEAVGFDGDRTATRGWLDYPIMTFKDIPEMDVKLVDASDHPSIGVGEGAAGPMTAAIGNALAVARWDSNQRPPVHD